jgi:hypothetical protein
VAGSTTSGAGGAGGSGLAGASVGLRGGFDVGLNRSFDTGRPGCTFDPQAIPGLQLWLDSATALVSGNILVSWTDLSGNQNPATQDNNDFRASYGPATQNYLPIISNDGINDNYTLGLDIGLITWDVLIVGKASTDSTILSNHSVNIQLRVDGPNNKLIFFDGSQSVTSGSLLVNPSGFSVWEWTRDPGKIVALFQNGVALGSNVDFGTALGAITLNSLWNRDGVANPLAPLLSVLVYNRKLLPAERADIVSFLRTRFSV